MDLILITEEKDEVIRRSVELTNEEWSILAMCADSYADTFRSRHSQIIATYVTRGQLEQAQAEAVKMNNLLMKLDRIQANLL